MLLLPAKVRVGWVVSSWAVTPAALCPSQPTRAPLADIKSSEAEIIHNASVPVLVEAALQRETGSQLTSCGALSVRSGAKTGRSPKDKRVVAEPSSEENVWWGPVNIKMSLQAFMINRERAIDYINTRDRVYVVDGFAGWDPKYRIRVRVFCCRAYHALCVTVPAHCAPCDAGALIRSLLRAAKGCWLESRSGSFMRNMLVDPTHEELVSFSPDLVIFNAGGFPANRYVEGMTSSCSVDLHLGRYSKRFGRTWAEMVILGTQYAGEMKKGILTLMMYKMPLCGQRAWTGFELTPLAVTQAPIQYPQAPNRQPYATLRHSVREAAHPSAPLRPASAGTAISPSTPS